MEEGVPGLSSSIRTGAGLPAGVEEVPIAPLLLLASSITSATLIQIYTFKYK
jgi:hypothetical protein